MDPDIHPRLNTAHRLNDEIKSIGGSSRGESEWDSTSTGLDQASVQGHGGLSSHRAIPVSGPDSLRGRLLKVVMSDATAKEDLSSRLHGVKASLVDLCDRQLNDLVDAGPSEQKDVEDIDNLLEEMRSVRRCMETVTAIERALNSS